MAGSQGHRRDLQTTERLSVSSTSHWDWGQGPWLSSWWHDLSRVSNVLDLYRCRKVAILWILWQIMFPMLSKNRKTYPPVTPEAESWPNLLNIKNPNILWKIAAVKGFFWLWQIEIQEELIVTLLEARRLDLGPGTPSDGHWGHQHPSPEAASNCLHREKEVWPK